MKKNRVIRFLTAAGILAGSLSFCMAAQARTITTDLFDLDCSDEWVCDEEEDISCYQGESSVTLTIPSTEEEDEDVLRLDITVKQNARNQFTERMQGCGFDAKAAMVDGAYETESIAGQTFYKEAGSFSSKYLSYSEEMNAYIFCSVGETPDDPRALEVLNTLRFHMTEEESDPIPWYWEGQPYSVEDHSVAVGGFTVTATQLKLENPVPNYDTFGSRIAYHEGLVYLLKDGVLNTCSIEGNLLTGETPMEVPYTPKEIATDNSGALYLSNTGRTLEKIAGGEVQDLIEQAGCVSVRPDGSLAAGWNNNTTVNLYNLADLSLNALDVSDQFSMATRAILTPSRLLVNGNLAEGSGAHLVIYDQNNEVVGELNKENTGSGFFGAVTAAVETPNGLIIVDGNMRDLYFTDLNGAMIANIDMQELFDTNYPWPASVAATEDGTILFAMTDERMDKSCDETIVYAVRGF